MTVHIVDCRGQCPFLAPLSAEKPAVWNSSAFSSILRAGLCGWTSRSDLLTRYQVLVFVPGQYVGRGGWYPKIGSEPVDLEEKGVSAQRGFS